MELNQQYRLLQQQAGVSVPAISGFYNPQGSPMRQAMMEPVQYNYNRDFSEDESYDGPLGPRSMPRRTKRNIPDGEKDARYWEKRKRNNEAAKRSRENKRKLDYEIRNRLGFLEEENALMRRELEILKTKLCIPVDQSVLGAEERAEILAAVEKTMGLKGASGSDEIEIIPGPIMMPGTMDLSKRGQRPMPVHIKREPDEALTFMTHAINTPLMSWQDPQSMTSYSPPDVIKRTGQFMDKSPTSSYQQVLQNPFLRNQRMAYDVYQMQQYQQPPSPQLERLPQSPPSISPVTENLNSSMNNPNMAETSRNMTSLNRMSEMNELRDDAVNQGQELRMKIGQLTRVGEVKDGRWQDHIE